MSNFSLYHNVFKSCLHVPCGGKVNLFQHLTNLQRTTFENIQVKIWIFSMIESIIIELKHCGNRRKCSLFAKSPFCRIILKSSAADVAKLVCMLGKSQYIFDDKVESISGMGYTCIYLINTVGCISVSSLPDLYIMSIIVLHITCVQK